jgi:hypothetical protein
VVAQCRQPRLEELGCSRKHLELEQGVELGLELEALLVSGLETLTSPEPERFGPQLKKTSVQITPQK